MSSFARPVCSCHSSVDLEKESRGIRSVPKTAAPAVEESAMMSTKLVGASRGLFSASRCHSGSWASWVVDVGNQCYQMQIL